MTNKLNILSSMILLLAGCVTLPSTTTTQTPSATEVFLLGTSQSTDTKLSATGTVTPTPRPEPTWTLPATLPAADSFSKINELLRTNGGCHLPCWWSITPGQTKWEEARNILFPLIDSISNYHMDNGEGQVGLFFPSLAHGAALVQGYTIKDNIVQGIEIRFNGNPAEQKVKLPDFGPFSTPKGILAEYGAPDAIYIGGSYEPGVINWQSFWLYLYYTKQRIFVEYDQGMEPPQPPDGLLSICFSESEIDYAEIHVWGPNDSFDQTLDLIFKAPGHSARPLEQVTKLTVDQFYKKFTDPNESPCFDTPAKDWLP